jgi:hypothetical protein
LSGTEGEASFSTNMGVLVLDAFKRHITHLVKGEIKKENTDLIMIRGSMTSQLQVSDMAISKHFKDRLRQLCTD